MHPGRHDLVDDRVVSAAESSLDEMANDCDVLFV
jgi:hypothetical protein